MSLPKPEGLQKEVLALPEKGHYVVLGSAGSGKTTLAILRAVYLSERECDKDDKVLIVTFNKSLVTYLKHMGLTKLTNIKVENFHKVARGYLNHKGMLKNGEIVPTKEYKSNNKLDLIKKAISEIKGLENGLKRDPEFYCDEIGWIQKMGIESIDEYLNADRVGRKSSRVPRSQRNLIFSLYLKYKEIRERLGFKYDWDDLGYFMYKALNDDKERRMYKHIIIDEGQDFSPVMLRALVKLIPDNGSITFFGDIAQQIYGSRVSWRSAGINVEKVWKFDQNYRNTKEIAELAIAISNHKYFEADQDLVVPKYPRASGPNPALIKFSSTKKELGWILDYAVKNSKNSTLAILTRNRGQVKQIENLLKDMKVKYQKLSNEMTRWNDKPGVTIGTYHSAKGLEFDTVMLPFCNKENIPDKSKLLICDNREEALSEDIKLIYVSVTRAKRALLMTYTGEVAEIIPDNKNKIYQEFSL